jgi:transposase-like protein
MAGQISADLQIMGRQPAGLCEFFKYPQAIRRAIRTTNAIESLQSRKAARSRSAQAGGEAIYKIMRLALSGAAKKMDYAD